MFLDGFHNLPRAGTAVHTGTFDADAVLFQIREDALQRVLLAETHVSIAIAVLYAHDEVTYDCHAGTVARELLVSHLCIVLLRLYELVVEVKVVRRSCHELACVHEHLHQQTVQFSSCIEVVDLSRVRSIGRVGAAQLRDSPENCVRAACAKSGMKREMGHQMARHILHTVAATEVDT